MNRKKRIEALCLKLLKPEYMQVEDQSALHQVPVNAQTHFRILLVCAIFSTQSRLERQKFIYSCLKDELNSGLHALSLHLYTPQEWEKRQAQGLRASPDCLHGYDKTT